MIKIEKEFPFCETYPLSRLGKREEILFFDIETTGFSGDFNNVYLIGCVYVRAQTARFIQWFADTRESEAQVIESFFSFLKSFSVLVHFNGDTFDLPFLLKRCKKLGLPYTFDHIASVDIYKRIKPYKKHLGLDSLKQKSIETFLGIGREDVFSGGQLIAVYEDYLKTKEEELLHLLLLHNEDDLKGMPKLLPILFYPDFFSQEFSLTDMEEDLPGTGSLAGTLRLTLRGDETTKLPVPIRAAVPSYVCMAAGNLLRLSIRLYQGTLKYYYPNYKDYYYLIYEDTAIHKSVGEYVDKDARIKATKETCYTKKTGVFLPQPDSIWTPEFKTSCKDKTGFFQYGPDCLSDPVKLNLYIKKIWAEVF